ncbi:acyl carrier protein [Thermaerobacillus caldiproteolyticus]|uniref:Acyl carrier protein n=1 Tax=Thermaerobacillus caldiproteolyticus TaxID=247480 RepID=A0A7W0C0F5_9BACL|nr:acyl carrier protein [Anoxybacillus caldiproteolyticus]MBA2875229.1 acyl carrier protein [Anoxybacillus caldiproteolyticus]QPA32829.1 acyl carrier protein [Anoxybacillus caldiproteolyticus]
MSFEEFRQLISEISKIPVEQINKNSSFRNDLGIDSLQMVNLLIEVAAKLKLELHMIQSRLDFQTVGGLYESFVKERE